MGDAFHDSHLGLCLVLKVSQGEGHRSELLGGLAEEFSRVLHLQHVRLLGALVHGDLRVTFTACNDFELCSGQFSRLSATRVFDTRISW